MRGQVLAAIAAAGLGVPPAAAVEHTRFEPLWIEPTAPGALRGVPATLNLPNGWQPGDAAAVLLFNPAAAPDLRHAVLGALLDRAAAVLELDANTARGFSADPDADPPVPTVESLVEDLAGALHALKRGAGAGLVVAIGHGLGGEAVLRAADPAVAVAAFGPEGPRFAAHASLGPGAAAFRPGAAQPPAEAWPLRAPLLCEALSWAAGAATASPDASLPRPAQEAATYGACRAALVPPEALAGRR